MLTDTLMDLLQITDMLTDMLTDLLWITDPLTVHLLSALLMRFISRYMTSPL
jgi:hypothetical protein